MPDNNNGSDNSGSPIAKGGPTANSLVGTTGQPSNTNPQIDPVQVKNLESLVGRQGQELGEYRDFFKSVAPLLDKLDQNPEIVQAVLDNKIDSNLAKAAIEGRIDIKDAAAVAQAQAAVTKTLGGKIENVDPNKLTDLIEAKAKEIRTEMDAKMKDQDDIRNFEQNVNDFISRTPDFGEFAGDIDKWLDEHDVTDIAVAYYAVKGELSTREAQKQAAKDQAEYEKGLASNAGGGQGMATYVRGGENLIDSLIASKSNPNIF